jgi:hypothetical protein
MISESTQPVRDARDEEFAYLARFETYACATPRMVGEEETKVAIQVPKYLRLKDDIAEPMENGTYARDSGLPSETEFGPRSGVTRMTARRPCDGPRCRRFVSRPPGLGTFVVGKALLSVPC